MARNSSERLKVRMPVNEMCSPSGIFIFYRRKPGVFASLRSQKPVQKPHAALPRKRRPQPVIAGLHVGRQLGAQFLAG